MRSTGASCSGGIIRYWLVNVPYSDSATEATTRLYATKNIGSPCNNNYVGSGAAAYDKAGLEVAFDGYHYISTSASGAWTANSTVTIPAGGSVVVWNEGYLQNVDSCWFRMNTVEY